MWNSFAEEAVVFLTVTPYKINKTGGRVESRVTKCLKSSQVSGVTTRTAAKETGGEAGREMVVVVRAVIQSSRLGI